MNNLNGFFKSIEQYINNNYQQSSATLKKITNIQSDVKLLLDDTDFIFLINEVKNDQQLITLKNEFNNTLSLMLEKLALLLKKSSDEVANIIVNNSFALINLLKVAAAENNIKIASDSSCCPNNNIENKTKIKK